MKEKILRITAMVVDNRTRRGIPGLRVEAWDEDQKYDDFLAVDTTDANGQVILTFAEGRWREYAPDLPDLYFKVYRGRKEVKSTKGSVIRNVKKSRKVIIEIDRPVSTSSGEDRLSASTVFKTVGFFHRSDFRGTGIEAGKTIQAPLGLIKDTLVSAVQNADMKPVKPGMLGKFRHSDIVGRDAGSVRKYLEDNQVEVTEQPYDPKANQPALTDLRSFPTRPKEGDKMTVYRDEHGTVRFYKVEPRTARTAPELAVAVERQEVRLEEVTRELQAVQEATEEKKEELNTLRRNIRTLSEDQKQMKEVVSAARLTKIERDIATLKKSRKKTTKKRPG